MGSTHNSRLSRSRSTYKLERRHTYVASKLTLSIDPDVVEAAKEYAASTGTSVSQLVEDYLAAITSSTERTAQPPILARLRGAMKDVDIDDFHRHVQKKYR